MATLSARDAERWDAVADGIVAAVRRRLGPEAVAPWPRGSSRAPFRRALDGARRAAGRMAARAPLLLWTDVADFYGSLSPRVVLDALRRAARDTEALEAAAMLEGWGSDGYTGLPIGPPGSAVVADAVLAQVDDALRPLPFLRWVDDYLIAVPSERTGDEALERLDEGLQRLGLVRSAPKTVLASGQGFRWLGTSMEPTTP